MLAYTPLDEQTIQRVFQGILEGYFRGCSGLFRGDCGRFLVENEREIIRKNEENYTGKNRKNIQIPIK